MSKAIFRIFGAAISIALAIGTTMPASAVTYGEEVIDASATRPWVASIWLAPDPLSDANFICSGSLISPEIVLTAAHCVTDPGIYYVQLAANTLEGDWVYIMADAVWKSPRYDKKKLQNDIGLLHLSQPALDIPVATLAKKSQTSKIDSLNSFVMFGWGDDQNGEVASFLRLAKLNQQKVAASRYFTSSQFNAKTTIAAGKYLASERVYSGSCSGDSGGPLTAKLNGVELVVGITSYGAQSCRVRVPSVFTKVTYYENDIRAGIRSVTARATAVAKVSPVAATQPSITGTPNANGILKCNVGSWGPGPVSVVAKWSAPGWTFPDETNVNVKLPAVIYRSTTLTCEVTATNLYGSTKAFASINIR